MFLPPADYEEYAPSGVGEQVHINHTNCSAGLDRKRRLYIKRTDTGVVAFCHHCGGHGVIPDKRTQNISVLRNKLIRETLTLDVPVVHYPPDVCFDPIHWHKDARAWVYKYNLSDEAIQRNQLSYSAAMHRVILPVFDEQDILTFWQARALDKHTTPKYLNKRSVAKPYMFLRTVNLSSSYAKTWVIVEDVLSAIRVSSVCNAIALLGTHMTNEVVLALRRETPHKVCVWLDADQAGWKGKMEVSQKLSLLFSNVSVISSTLQPKEATIETITKEIT